MNVSCARLCAVYLAYPPGDGEWHRHLHIRRGAGCAQGKKHINNTELVCHMMSEPRMLLGQTRTTIGRTLKHFHCAQRMLRGECQPCGEMASFPPSSLIGGGGGGSDDSGLKYGNGAVIRYRRKRCARLVSGRQWCNNLTRTVMAPAPRHLQQACCSKVEGVDTPTQIDGMGCFPFIPNAVAITILHDRIRLTARANRSRAPPVPPWLGTVVRASKLSIMQVPAAAAPAARLITIPCSHFCEKSRWTLDWLGIPFQEEGHAPGMHRFSTRSNGGSTVPLLTTDASKTLLTDSSDIVTWANEATAGQRRLLPEDPLLRAEALKIEDMCDEVLGPATRIVAYHYLLQEKALTVDTVAPVDWVPAWERVAIQMGFFALAPSLRRGLDINDTTCAKAVATIDDVFIKLAARLEGGNRRYLVGDRFSVADLAFASLASPVLLPPEMPLYHRLLAIAPPAYVAVVTRFRNTEAGRHAMRMFAEERRSATASSTSSASH